MDSHTLVHGLCIGKDPYKGPIEHFYKDKINTNFLIANMGTLLVMMFGKQLWMLNTLDDDMKKVEVVGRDSNGCARRFGLDTYRSYFHKNTIVIYCSRSGYEVL